MILLALFLAQDPLAMPVTLPSTVSNVKSVVRALSESTHVQLAVHPTLEREIVGLAIPARPLKQAMDALGLALDAEWTKKGEVYSLARTNKLLDARRKRDLDMRIKNIQDSFAEQAKNYTTETLDEAAIQRLVQDTSGAGKNNFEVLARSPLDRLLRGLIANIPFSDFARLRADERVVYVLEPNQVQRRLPPGSQQLIQRYAKEQRMLNDALDKASDLQQRANLHAHNSDGTFATATLTAFRQQLFQQGMVGIELRLYNEKGAAIASTGLAVVQTGFLESAVASRPFEAPKDDISVEPTRNTVRFRAHLVRRSTRKNDILPFPPEMDDLLRHPDQREPLAMVAEVPLAVMSGQRKQLVAAALPDSLLFDLVRSPGDGRTTLARWEDDLRLHFVERLGDSQTVIYRPKMPIFAEEFFTDRTAFAKFLTKVGRDGRFSLDARSQFAHAMGASDSYYAQAFFSRLRIPPPFFGAFVDDERFFGSLTAAQRKTLVNGGVLTMRELSPWQRDYFYRKPYRGEAKYRSGGPAISPEQRREAFTYLGGILAEPTHVLPNGLPDDFEVRAKVVEATTYHTVADSPRVFAFELNAPYMAQIIHARETGDDSVSIGDSFEEAKTTRWIFEVRMAGSAWTGLQYDDHQFSGTRKKQSELPETMRAEIEKELAARRKNQSAPPKDKVPPP